MFFFGQRNRFIVADISISETQVNGNNLYCITIIVSSTFFRANQSANNKNTSSTTVYAPRFKGSHFLMIPNQLWFLFFSVEYSMSKHLCRRVQRGFAYSDMTDLWPEDCKTLVVSGGVGCNARIRSSLQQVTKIGLRLDWNWFHYNV